MKTRFQPLLLKDPRFLGLILLLMLQASSHAGMPAAAMPNDLLRSSQEDAITVRNDAPIADGPNTNGWAEQAKLTARDRAQVEALRALVQGRIIPTDSPEEPKIAPSSPEYPARSTTPLALAGTIAFETNRGGTFDIYSQRADGNSPAVPLVTTTGDDFTPVWSPDGTQFVFASDQDGDFDIYLRTAEGQVVNLTRNAAHDAHPSWSPSGDRIIFASDRGGTYFQIYTMRLNGTDVQRVGLVPDSNAAYPRYSPDGSKIAFMRASTTSPLCQWNWDVWVMDANGDNQRRVTTAFGADLYPAWTPDGREIIYASCRNFLDFDLYAVNPDTGVERQLTSWYLWNEWGATFSPDGEHIAFNTDIDGNTEIYTMPAAGGTAANLTQNSADDLMPSWTPIPARIDLSVDHIEVSQVLLADEIDPATGQSIDESIPLIAEKHTLVRVYVGVSGATEVDGVTARLRLYVQDAQGHPHEVRRPYGPRLTITAKADPDPHNIDDTLNFLPQVNWLRGNVTFRAVVDPDNQIVETDENNNTGVVAEPFEAGQDLRIAWVLMPYQPNPSSPPIYADESVPAGGTTFLRKIYPAGVRDIEYFQQPAIWITPMTQPFSRGSTTDYLRALNRFWRLTTLFDGWIGGQPPDRLYGWVPKEAKEDICGVADARYVGLEGRVAAGLAVEDRTCSARKTMAHELGHILDDQNLRHAPNWSQYTDSNCYEVPSNIDVHYPRYDGADPLGTIGVWGVYLGPGAYPLLSPNNTYDFMTYCYNKWVSPYNYRQLVRGFASFPAEQLAIPLLSTQQSRLLVSGLVYTPTLTVTFDTFYPLTSTVPPDASRGTDYCLELRSVTETPLDSRCFDLTFTNPETGDQMDKAAFALVLPYPDATHSVVLTHQGAELGRVTASSNAPTVHLISPNGGEFWGATGDYTVSWTARDPDGDPLHFIVSYSPDGGNTWLPLAFDVDTSSLTIDSAKLPGSANALFKVVATDQMHAAEDISDAPFSVERKGPKVYILSPERDATVTPGMPVWLEGYAHDAEDSTLGEAALRWTSSQDGDLGTGDQVVTDLSAGEHTITLAARDSDGNIGSASINVFVGYRTYLPFIAKGHQGE